MMDETQELIDRLREELNVERQKVIMAQVCLGLGSDATKEDIGKAVAKVYEERDELRERARSAEAHKREAVIFAERSRATYNRHATVAGEIGMVVKKTIECIDRDVALIIKRPGMYTGSSRLHHAEVLVTWLLYIRSELCEASHDSYCHRQWCKERYPQIPAPIREISNFVHDDWRYEDEANHNPDLEVWAREINAFVEYAVKAMEQEQST